MGRAWWLETQQPREHFFHGGFLGKDNISIIDRNSDIPEGGWIAQADSAGWMAFFALNLLAMAVELERDEDASYFLRIFLSIRESLQELWNHEEAYYFDEVHLPEGECIPLKIRSMVGLVPLIAGMVVDPARLEKLPGVHQRLAKATAEIADLQPNADGKILLSAVPQDRVKHLLDVLLDPEEFRSPFGLRSLSKFHAEHPVTLELGDKTFKLEYTPSYSQNNMFGGNSNWRGPIWPPLNQLLIEALYMYDEYFGAHTIHREGNSVPLADTIFELVASLISIFKPDQTGHRPYLGDNEIFQQDARWHTMYWFHEHFHPETGEGLGATHQNGWTAFVASLIQNQSRGRLHLRALQT